MGKRSRCTSGVEFANFFFYNENLKSAFGLSFVNDQIGLSQAINPMFTYAYRITEDENWSISFGASAGIFSRSYNSSLFDPLETDPLITGTEVNLLTVPDVNVGVEFQSKSIISGISATHILNRNVNDNSYINTTHKYAYVIYKNTDLDLINFYIGSLMVNRANLTTFEFNGSVRFKNPTGLNNGSKELFDVGLTYRTSKILTLLFGFNISENIRVGYAYDQSFVTGLSLNGSHEIMLEYRIPLKSAQCEVCRNTDYWYR